MGSFGHHANKAVANAARETIMLEKLTRSLDSLTRRRALAGLAAAGITPTLTMAPARADDGEAVFFGWAGYDDENLWQDYVAANGAQPEFTFWGDEEEGLAKVRAGFAPDVVFPCNYKIQKWVDAGVLQPIDLEKLEHWPDVMKSLHDVPGSVVDGERYWVPIDWGLTSVIFRTDLAPEYVGNDTWEILWDPKYQGQVAVFDSLVDGVVIAGIVEGLDDPFDYSDQASLDAIRPRLEALTANLRFYSNDPTTMEQGLASGELVAATVWNDSVVRLTEQGLPVQYMNPKEGAMTWVCGLSIAKDAPNPDKAHELIDAFLSPESRAYEMTAFGFGGATYGGFELVDEETLKSLGLSKNPEDILSAGVYQQPIKGEPALQSLFEEVKVGI